MVGNPDDLVGREGAVQAHRRTAGVHQGKIGDNVLWHIPSEDESGLAWGEAQPCESERQVAYHLPVLRVGQALPAAVASPLHRTAIREALCDRRESLRQRPGSHGGVDVLTFLREVTHTGPPLSSIGCVHRRLTSLL